MADRVPICGSRGTATVSRAIWDEAWIVYSEKYGGSESQHDRLLRQGFYAGELDDLRPGWRPVEQRITALQNKLTEIESLARRGVASNDSEHSCVAVESCVAILNAAKSMLDGPEAG